MTWDWDEVCGRTADSNEIDAVTSWVATMEPSAVRQFGVRVERAAGALALFVPGTGTAFHNRVLGLGVTQEATRPLVRQWVGEYRRLETGFMVHVAPYARPGLLADWLADEGLEHGSNWFVMHRDDQPVPPREQESPITVRAAARSDADAFAETLCSGYGMPAEWAPLYRGFVGHEPWRHFVALDGDQVVGTSSMFHNGQNAWLGNSATLPRYRKRGVQTALNGERLRVGLAEHHTAFTGETWEPGRRQDNQSLRNHLRDGWVRAYVRHNYAANPFGSAARLGGRA
jgi:hypothetical protein